MGSKLLVLAPLLILFAAFLLRMVDIFVLHVDDVLGDVFFSKSLGLLLVVGYMLSVGMSLKDIGLHRKYLGRAALIGGGGALLFFGLGYELQLALLAGQGKQASIALITAHGVILYPTVFLVGAFISVLMEEMLFRGLILGQFVLRIPFWRAILLHAVLFGAWHLVWPVEAYLEGWPDVGAAAWSGITIFGSTGMSGVVWGYMYLKTGSLWASWLAHSIHNVFIHVVYIRTGEGLLPADDFLVFEALFIPGMVSLMLLTRVLTRKEISRALKWRLGRSGSTKSVTRGRCT